jgi:hypothetical protein
MNQHTRLTLSGLDGSNPLAFLAALGTLRVLTRAWPERDPRLGWESHGGRWTPFLETQGAATPEDVVAALDPALRMMDGHRAFTFAPDLKLPADRFAEFSRQAGQAARTGGDTVAAEFAAAFACEATVNEDGTVQGHCLPHHERVREPALSQDIRRTGSQSRLQAFGEGAIQILAIR